MEVWKTELALLTDSRRFIHCVVTCPASSLAEVGESLRVKTSSLITMILCQFIHQLTATAEVGQDNNSARMLNFLTVQSHRCPRTNMTWILQR